MDREHSDFAPFYLVSYTKNASNKRSVSPISQWMRLQVILKYATRGSVRGNYFIRGEILGEFKKVISKVDANPTIKKVSDEDATHLSKILSKPGPSIPATIAGGDGMESDCVPQLAIPGDLPAKIAGINETLLRIETHIQNGGTERKISPEPAARETNNSNGETRAAWQEVLNGFQLYRDIFQTGMDNPKTQDGLYAALSEIAQRHGISEKEALKKMDGALVIAKKFADAGA